MSANPSYRTSEYTMTTHDIAERYRYTIGYVRLLASTGEIPCIRVGRGKLKTGYRFHPDEVAEALRGRERQLACDDNKVGESDDAYDDLGV